MDCMFYRGVGIALTLGFIAAAHAQRPAPASAPSVSQPMSQETLAQIYQKELGSAFVPTDQARLYQANVLIERYFAHPESRSQVLTEIQALGLDPNVVGRLARVRLTWLALEPGVYYINEKLGPSDVRYFLGVPKGYDRSKPWPLVIKLPTADAFVGDPVPDPQQASQIYSEWMTQELTAHPQALVIMPLLNLDVLWGPSYPGMDSVILPMQHATSRVNIDPARVYLFGHSMSGHAAWNIPLHYPTYFAAFAALAGAASGDWQRVRMMNLRNTLPVVWHDADDNVILPDSSRQVVRLIQILKLSVDYTETKGIGHVPTPAIAEQMYGKMVARTRDLYPKQVSVQSTRPDTMFNRDDWVQIYQPLNPGTERRLVFTRGGGIMRVYDGSWSVDATISNNVISVTSRNVESMRFYLNDQMVDLARPVSVVVNRRPRFEGVLNPDLDQMLKDQLFLGRGWRYYTAVIDIDLAADRAATTRSN